MDEKGLFTKFWSNESKTTRKVLARIPKGSDYPSPMAWSFLFDIVHHRGQITTYLRPMGSTVPQIYGPSGDEPTYKSELNR